MKSAALTTAALAVVLTPAFADPLKVINLPNVAPPRGTLKSHRKLQTRDGPVQVSVANELVTYAITLGLGTPAQNINFTIDTGSSDLWVPEKGSSLCNSQNVRCSSFGSFSPNSSSSIQSYNPPVPFEIQYGDGSQVQGQFVQDTVQVGTATVTSAIFAVASRGASSAGIAGVFGVGYEAGESFVDETQDGETYPNVLAEMVSQNLINSRAYSLWLNDPNSLDGNILFGGVDTTKYQGNLVAMPVVPNPGNYSRLFLPLTGVSFAAGGQSFRFTPSTFAIPALIDSGTTLMYLPDSTVNAIYEALGVRLLGSGDQQGPYLPCSDGNDNSAQFTFSFNGDNGANITVTLNDILIADGSTIGGQAACAVGIFPASQVGGGFVILGDTFMRSAYVVYDLDNNMIAVANAKFNVTSSAITAISGSTIPGASMMSTLVSGLATGGSTATATAEPDPFESNGQATQTAAASITGALVSGNIPTFSLASTGSGSSSTGSHNAAAGSARPASIFSAVGVFAIGATVMGVFGGAMFIWF